MKKYCAEMSAEKKEIVRLYDREHRRAEHYEKFQHSSPNYNKIVYRSKQVLKILGTDSVQHCEVLGHVLRKGVNSPSKRKGILRKCQEISGCSKENSDDEFKTPPKELNCALRKLAIYCSAGKYDKAREMVDIIKSKTKNIATAAAESGNEYSHVYRLMNSPKK